MSGIASSGSAFGVLRQFVRRPQPVEFCEMCRSPVGTVHQHLFDPVGRKVICSCDACAILFDNEGKTKYKRVPRRIRYLADFRMTDPQWDSLMTPINMAFFFKSTPMDRVIAMYPSPAGTTESSLALESWREIVDENAVLEEMEPDVEALLVNRIGQSRGFSAPAYFIVPIDRCYQLTGLIRQRWRGLSGGAEVWQDIARFFEELKSQSPSTEPGRA